MPVFLLALLRPTIIVDLFRDQPTLLTLPDRYAESEKRDSCIVIKARGKFTKFNEVREVIN